MIVEVGDTRLWVDMSGPAVIVESGEVKLRPTIVSVHGGPGLDHFGMRQTLAPVVEDMQVVFYDQRGHGRSDYSDAAHWNLTTWATDLRNLCDRFGLQRPVVIGTSFGGFVALTYAALFPDHPGGVILANTTGGRTDHARSVEMFQRISGQEAAAVAARSFTELTEEASAEFYRVCYPLFSAKPGYAEEAAQRLRLSIHTTAVNVHYWRNEADSFDAWALLPQVICPVLVIAGEQDPMCPIELVEQLVGGLVNSASVELLRLPTARHTVFRDEPLLVTDAVNRFMRHAGPRRQ